MLGHEMKGVKITAIVLGVVLAFLVGLFVESHIRSLRRKPIPVVVEATVPARVKAYVQPDFLWAGEAWWIEVTADVPLVIDLDGKWNALLPSGTNTIYSNHDANNTTDFNSNRWWKTPSRITVKERPKQVESTVPVKTAPSASSSVR